MNQLLILASPAVHPSTEAFWKNLGEAVVERNDLYVYCLHEGAQSLADPRLANPNVRLFSCPRAAERFSPTPLEHLTLGGPGLLAELVDRSSSIRAYTPS